MFVSLFSFVSMVTEFIQRFQPAVEHTVSHKFRSTEDFEMNMGYINYVMEEQGKIMRLFPSDKDSNGDRIFQFSKSRTSLILE